MRAINKNVSHIQDYLTIQNTNIGREKSFNLLGVVIDEHLNWKSHTDKIANKISKNIGVLNQLKHYLPMQTLRTLYCMIQTHLNYWNLAWGIECNRLNKLQKRAIRTICISKYNDHTEGLFKERKLLKFPDLVFTKFPEILLQIQTQLCRNTLACLTLHLMPISMIMILDMVILSQPM